MSKTRIDLHNILLEIMQGNKVYYQPPESLKMQYPAIVYFLDDIDTKNADNSHYNKTNKYKLILIDRNPDSEFIAPISELPFCKLATSPYQSDGLNHFVFSIYF